MPRHHAGMYKAPTGTSGTGVARTVAALRSARNADRHQLFTAARNIQPDSPIIGGCIL